MQRDRELSAIQFGRLGVRLLPQRLRICRLSNLFRNVAVGIGTILFALGCYSPNIASRGYACGSDGGCPDKFHCASDHRCYQEADAQIDMPVVCNAAATTVPVCSLAATSGPCNPGCQSGCNGCGWCGVVAGVASCMIGQPGTHDIGDLCDPTKTSDCKAGLYCLSECGTGRCYKFCDHNDPNSAAVCGSGSSCSMNVRGGSVSFSLCSLASTCDPVAQTTATCPAPFACYPAGIGGSECDCPGMQGTGQPCVGTVAHSCIKGDSCFAISGSSYMCLQTCRVSTDCASGTSCQTQSTSTSTYSYCI
jgi:hypothetical protein